MKFYEAEKMTEACVSAADQAWQHRFGGAYTDGAKEAIGRLAAIMLQACLDGKIDNPTEPPKSNKTWDQKTPGHNMP